MTPCTEMRQTAWKDTSIADVADEEFVPVIY